MLKPGRTTLAEETYLIKEFKRLRDANHTYETALRYRAKVIAKQEKHIKKLSEQIVLLKEELKE